MKRDNVLYQFLKKCENPPDSLFWKIFNTLFCTSMIIWGYFLYIRINKKNQNKVFILFPTTSAGDLVFFKVIEKEFIRCCCPDNGILILDERNKKAAESLDYKGVWYMSYTKIAAINMARVFLQEKMSNVINAYPWNMFDYYKAENIERNYPKYKTSDNVKDLCKQIKPQKTVIICPYEYSVTVGKLPVLPMHFWERLVEGLQQRGYCVVTNCKGNSIEQPVKGTERIFPAFGDIEAVLSYAGNVVGVRSGFFDYSANANAKKVVLHPTDFFYNKWSIERIWNSKTVQEIVYSEYLEDRIEELVSLIVKSIITE